MTIVDTMLQNSANLSWVIASIVAVLFLLSIVYVVYTLVVYDERFLLIIVGNWFKSAIRPFYRKPSFTVLALSILFATTTYYLFDQKATVFASILYASLFFLNETLRSDHPFPSIVDMKGDTTQANEDDRISESEGVLLADDITVKNNGYGDLKDFSLMYKVYPISRNKVKDRSIADFLDQDWNESEDTMSESASIERGQTKEFNIELDLISDDIFSARYHVLVKAVPPKNYSFLTHRAIHTVEFNDQNGTSQGEQ